jgi:hypothetical protein
MVKPFCVIAKERMAPYLAKEIAKMTLTPKRLPPMGMNHREGIFITNAL